VAAGGHGKLLHRSGMAVHGISVADALEAQRRVAGVLHLRVSEGDHAGLVNEPEPGELVAVVLLEPSVGEGDGRVGLERRRTAVGHEERVFDRNALGQVRVPREHRAPIACRADDGDDLNSLLVAEGLQPSEALDVGLGLPVEQLQAGGEHHAVHAVLGTGADQLFDAGKPLVGR